MLWCDVEHYLKTLHLIALCYLLQREDLLPRLLEVILANAEDDLEPDTTIEDFLDYHFKNRPDPDYVQMGKHAILFGEAMRGETKEEQLEELNAYLKDWYNEMVGMSDLEYQSHLDPEQNGFCGYWAFEAAAIVYLDDLDDTELRNIPIILKIWWIGLGSRNSNASRIKIEAATCLCSSTRGTPVPVFRQIRHQQFHWA